MKSFFNYFKAREAVEKTGNRAANPAEIPSGSASVKDESSAIQTGSQSLRKALGMDTAIRQSGSIGGGKGPEVRAIVLELGDFLRRIPPEFLRPGDHQLERELRFGIDEVANNIARGKATISLSEIVKQCPEIFKDSIVGRNNIEIFFPWQKLARQVDVLLGYRARAKHKVETPEAGTSAKESESAWHGDDSRTDSGSEGEEAVAAVPSGADIHERNEHASKSVLGHELDAAARAGDQIRLPGGEAHVLKTQIAELVAEREKILVELAETRFELEPIRKKAAQLPAANASLESAERQIEMLRCQLREAIEAKEELGERFRKAEADIKSAEVLRRDLEKAVEGRQRAVKELEAMRAEMQTLRETNASARTELIVNAAEIEKAKGIAEARVRELEQHIVHLDSKFESLTLERGKSEGEASQFRGHHARLIASLKLERDNAFNSRDELREEMKRIREELQKKVDVLTAERDALKREKSQFNSQIDQLRSNHKKQIDFLNSDTEKRVSVLNRRVDMANAERDKLVGELRDRREQFNAEIEDLRLERLALTRARDEAIAHERDTRKEFEDEFEKLKRQGGVRFKE